MSFLQRKLQVPRRPKRGVRFATTAVTCGFAIWLSLAGGATATAAPVGDGPASLLPVPTVAQTGIEPAAEELGIRFGGVEAWATCGAFLYGTAVVYVLRSVVKDRREDLAGDVLALS